MSDVPERRSVIENLVPSDRVTPEEAFRVYRKMGKVRSLPRLAHMYNVAGKDVSLKELKQWQAEGSWDDTIAAETEAKRSIITELVVTVDNLDPSIRALENLNNAVALGADRLAEFMANIEPKNLKEARELNDILTKTVQTAATARRELAEILVHVKDNTPQQSGHSGPAPVLDWTSVKK